MKYYFKLSEFVHEHEKTSVLSNALSVVRVDLVAHLF